MKFALSAAFLTLLSSGFHTADATDTALVRCGNGSVRAKLGCTPKLVPKTEKYGVRCCSQEKFYRAKKRTRGPVCNFYAGSVTNIASPGLAPGRRSGEFCPNELTFDQAKTMCKNMGAEMCTEEEMRSGCTKVGGCNMNRKLVWVNDLAPTSSPTEAPTESPTKAPTLPAPSVTPSEEPSSIPSEFLTAVPVNVALGKPTAQSSTYEDGVSSRAVDGNRDGDYAKGSVTHTNNLDSNAWWYVSLEQKYHITSIKVFSRTACTGCSNRLENFHLEIFNNGVQVWTYQHNGNPGYEADIVVSTREVPVFGDKVEISIAHNHLYLAEVEVYAV